MANTIKFEGLEEVTKALNRGATSTDDIKKVVQFHGAELQKLAVQNAVFRGHMEGSRFVKPTGNLRRSITLELRQFGMSAEVEPTASYGAYVELGTRYMAAQPYLKPAFDAENPKFIRDLKKLIE